MAEAHDGCDKQMTSLPASSSPLSSRCYSSFQTWLQAGSPLQQPRMIGRQMKQGQDSWDHHVGMHPTELPSSGFFEELFCTSQTSFPVVPLPGALMTSSCPQSDVVKQGYLGKLERNQRRYFVLRAGSHTGPSRLEWYKTQEKFRATEKPSGKAALFGSSKQGVIYLRCCLGVSRIGSCRKGHTVALYAKDQTMVLLMEDQQEQDEWYLSIKKLMEEERKDEEHREGLEEEDDGYCTLPPAASFKEVWPVTVKPKGLGRSKSLAGETRLCLTATSLVLVRVSTSSDLPSVTIPLLSVRRFGHLDGSFFLELGRSAPNGPGEIWMEARDQGNPAAAQNIHEVIRETVRALRALPDFSRSPVSSNQSGALLVSKRSRPKYRGNLVNGRPLSSSLALQSKTTYILSSPKQCYLEPNITDKTELESSLSITSHLSPFPSQQSCTPETDSYMEMKIENCSVSGSRVQAWQLAEDKKRQGYMMMSPQASHSSSVLPRDDYVTMGSPHKYDHSANSSSFSHQTSFSSSTSDSFSPLFTSHHQTSKHSVPHWLVSVCQSETGVADSQMDDITDKWTSPKDRHPAQTSVDGSALMAPFDISGPVYIRQIQASPNSGTDQSSPLQAAPFKSIRRNWLSSCLPSCLQAEDIS